MPAPAGRRAQAVGVRRQPGRPYHGEIVPAAGRAHRARYPGAALDDAAGARRGSRCRARGLCPARRCGRLRPFFSDLPAAHRRRAAVVISRSGASTVAELSAIGARHSGAAAACARSGPGGECRRAGSRRRGDPHSCSKSSPPQRLADEIVALSGDPEQIGQDGYRGKISRYPRRRERLADVVMRVAKI